MQLKVTVKQLGKKRPAVDQKTIEMEGLPSNPLLSDLLKAVVRQQVQAFNQKLEEKPIVPFLLSKEIHEKTITGKVGFGDIYNDQKADEKAAIDNALLAFEDGIYCVFIDDEQIEKLHQEINLTPQSVLAFVRLTFLSGSIW